LSDGANTRAARTFVAPDAVPLAEAPEVEGADLQAELAEMRAQFARAVGFAGGAGPASSTGTDNSRADKSAASSSIPPRL